MASGARSCRVACRRPACARASARGRPSAEEAWTPDPALLGIARSGLVPVADLPSHTEDPRSATREALRRQPIFRVGEDLDVQPIK